jgi:DNA-directed RNA polymerase subunit M/transcription elongation factor TFIIS
MNEVRQYTVEKLQEASPELNALWVQDLEIGIWNFSIDFAEKYRVTKSWKDERFSGIYKHVAMKILGYFTPGSYTYNPKILSRLLEGEFKPHNIPYMKSEHLFPDKWMDLIDRKMKRNENMETARQTAKTDQFKCSKCKKRECTYYELQTRSADEPSTIFVSCLNCGNRWRMG